MTTTTFTNGVTLTDASWFQDVNDYVYTPATQAQQEAGSITTKPVTPGTQHFHPSAAKGWVIAGVTGNELAGYNVASIEDSGTGYITVSWANDFSSANYAVSYTVYDTVKRACSVDTIAAGATGASCQTLAGAPVDPSAHFVIAFGDQA